MYRDPTVHDEDPFRRRLDEINREMQDLLNAGKRSPHDDALGARGAGIGDVHGGNTSGAYYNSPTTAAGAAAGSPWDSRQPQLMSANDTMRREIQLAVSKEMRVMEEHVRNIISKEWDIRVRELDAVLRGRFQELKAAHDTLGQSVIEVTTSLHAKLADMELQLRRVDADQRKQIAELQREWKQHVREMQTVRDIAADVEEQMKADSRMVDRRVEEITKRHGELVRSALGTLDGRLGTAQRELEAAQRDSRKHTEAELDQMARSLSRLQGAMEASSGVLDRLLGELQEVSEQTLANQSAVRACRSDVNRLEVTARAALSAGAPGTTGASSTSRGGTGGWQPPQSDGAGAPGEVYRLQQDVFSLKECVAYLYSTMQQMTNGAVPASSHPPPDVLRRPANGVGNDSIPPPIATADPQLNLSRPPYVTSTRSTPTKASRGAASQGFPPLSAGAILPSGGVSGAEAGDVAQPIRTRQLSTDGPLSSAGPSPTYRTVPDSDSEEERENSKLARSELD